jgi:hypothetical protein
VEAHAGTATELVQASTQRTHIFCEITENLINKLYSGRTGQPITSGIGLWHKEGRGFDRRQSPSTNLMVGGLHRWIRNKGQCRFTPKL